MKHRDPILTIAEAIHDAYNVDENNMDQFPSAYTLAKKLVAALRDNNYALIDLGELVD